MSGSFSTTRLDHLHRVMAGYVERGAVPGIVTLLERRGEVHVDGIGTQAFDGVPMRRDTIFRISSMTKPITAVAAMVLVEECRLRLDDPIDALLPELHERRVLRSLDAFHGMEGNIAIVYEVAPQTAFGFGKGAVFSQTRWRF